MNKVSVIIPCYNSEKTILDAVSSVLKQTYKVYEIICVDDGSTDKTIAILNELALTNTNLKIIKKEFNSGPAESRNVGLDQVSPGVGVIAFLDSDDQWGANKIEVQLAAMAAHQADLVASLFSVGKACDHLNDENEITKVKKVTFKQALFKNYFITSSVIMKKNDLRFNVSMKYSEDYELWLRFLKKNKKAILVEKELCYLSKPAFGAGGLSANLWSMELGELNTLNKHAYWYIKPLALLCSILKFIRRLVIVRLGIKYKCP